MTVNFTQHRRNTHDHIHHSNAYRNPFNGDENHQPETRHMKLTSFSIPESLETVWSGLHGYREDCIPEGQEEKYDEEWSDICTAMAWITEALGYDYDENGELTTTTTN